NKKKEFLNNGIVVVGCFFFIKKCISRVFFTPRGISGVCGVFWKNPRGFLKKNPGGRNALPGKKC
ncbi:hypothetical protein ACVGXP_07255, partial [Enterobacter hormaechei]